MLICPQISHQDVNLSQISPQDVNLSQISHQDVNLSQISHQDVNLSQISLICLRYHTKMLICLRYHTMLLSRLFLKLDEHFVIFSGMLKIAACNTHLYFLAWIDVDLEVCKLLWTIILTCPWNELYAEIYFIKMHVTLTFVAFLQKNTCHKATLSGAYFPICRLCTRLHIIYPPGTPLTDE